MGVAARGGRRHGGYREKSHDKSLGNGKRVEVKLKFFPWQMDVRNALIAGAKLAVLACGARSGKDRFGNQFALEFLYRKANARLEAEKRGAEPMIPRVNAWMVAPTDALWQQNWDEFLKFIPEILILEKNKQRGIIRLRGDIRISFKSADRPETLVSEGLDLLIITEASRVRSAKAWEESLAPRLISPGRDGVALINGTTACGKGHWYYKLWEKCVEAENKARRAGDINRAKMRQWRLPTTCNPLIPDRDIAELRGRMTDRTFRTEIMAEWADEDAKPFRDADVAAMDVRDGEPVTATAGFVKGLDIARKHDQTFCAVGLPGEAGKPSQVIHAMAMQNKRVPVQVDACVEIEKRYPGEWVVDSTATGGQYFIDLMREAMPGVRIRAYDFTSTSKADLVEGLQYAIEMQGRDGDKLILRRDLIGDALTDQIKYQLGVFEVHVDEKNKVTYHGPGGRDDDAVIAVGLMWTRLQFRSRVSKFNINSYLAKLMG